MQEIHLKRNWWVFGLFLAASIGCALIAVYAITWPAIKATQMGLPLSGGWSWPTIIIADIAMIILAAYLSYIPLTQLRMVFTDKGIKTPGVLESKFIEWDDVRYLDGISVRSSLLRITTSDQSIIINKFYYQHPDELMSLIHSHVPPSCSWRD